MYIKHEFSALDVIYAALLQFNLYFCKDLLLFKVYLEFVTSFSIHAHNIGAQKVCKFWYWNLEKIKKVLVLKAENLSIRKYLYFFCGMQRTQNTLPSYGHATTKRVHIQYFPRDSRVLAFSALSFLWKIEGYKILYYA